MPNKSNTRRLRLGEQGSYDVPSFPKHFVEALGWIEDDKLAFIPDPIEGTLMIKNLHREPIGVMKFMLKIDKKNQKSSPKKYNKSLKQNKSPEAKYILYKTDWEKVSTLKHPDEDYIRYLKNIVEDREQAFKAAKADLEVAEKNFKKQGGGNKQK